MRRDFYCCNMRQPPFLRLEQSCFAILIKEDLRPVFRSLMSKREDMARCCADNVTGRKAIGKSNVLCLFNPPCNRAGKQK